MARVALAAKVIGDHLKTLAEGDRETLRELLAVEDVDRMTIRADDGTELGKITRTGRTPKASITDEAAFMAWVKANRPDQIRTIVDTEYRRAVIKRAAADGIAADPETGEVIPGIEVGESEGGIRVTDNAASRNLGKALLLGHNVLQLGQAKTAPARPVVDAPDVADWAGLDEIGGDPW